jgi:signal transduction histidine kinase
MQRKENRKRLLILASLIAILSVLHYTTDASADYFHEFYKLLYYVPIILGAFHFGVRGGLIVSGIVSAIYLPHVLVQWHGTGFDVVHRILEVVVFNTVAYIVGRLAEGERNQRVEVEKMALALEESYTKLKQQSEMLSEVEEQLRHSERLSVMGELAASLAHEVRNPLGSIRGAVEILEEECPHGDKSYRFLQILIKEVERLNYVIESFLGLARQKTSEITRVSIQEAVDSIVQIISAKARKENIAIECQLPAQTVYITADGNKFRQVLLNLLLNAMAACISGGRIKIQSQMKNHDIELPCLELSIADNGTGIPENELDKIFKPFYTSKKDGTGLGLPISKRISEEYNWQLNIDSKEGEGTLARLCIPLPGTEVQT